MFTMRVVSRSALLAVLAACGDNLAAPFDAPPMDPVDSGLDEDGCRILTVGKIDLHFTAPPFGQLLGVRYPVMPNLAGASRDVLKIELWDSTTEGLTTPLAPGTFDLAAAGETDLGTCQHCVWVDADENADGTVDTIYFQEKGSLTLDQVTDPLAFEFAGHTASRLVLRRASVSEDGHSTFEPGGDCVSIENVSFDTNPTPGRACASAEDCGNPLLEICDPATNTCASPQCDVDHPCPEFDQACVIQYRDLFYGACYQTCSLGTLPTATDECGADQLCVQLGPDPNFGICRYTGIGAAGDVCELEDNETSCAGTAVCSRDTNTCAPTCNFYDAAPGCPAGSMCSLFGVCEPPSSGSAVALGDPCGPDDSLAKGCAPDGDAFRGICFGNDDALVCEKVCFVGDLGCGAEEFCSNRFTSGLGVCLPLPVCGDGVRGEINEVCDDGNQVDGDGCSADCQTIDANVFCAAATALVFGVPVQENTTDGRDGLFSTCQAFVARAELFSVTPPGPGRLRLHLTSPTSHTVSLRTTCADIASELACRSDFGDATDEELTFQVTDAVPAPLTAMVSANGPLDEGPFMLTAEFVPELCGDAVVAGNEVCDDGNQTSNDGCRADCRAIEYNVYCAQAPLLSTTMPTSGTTVGAPALFASSCSFGDPAGLLRRNRLYRYIAPAAGTLHLSLTDQTPSSFSFVSVLDRCGTPDTVAELGCTQAFNNLDIPLAAGQEITVVIGNVFTEDMDGAYELTATFTAQ